jgi:hypothetical protein
MTLSFGIAHSCWNSIKDHVLNAPVVDSDLDVYINLFGVGHRK